MQIIKATGTFTPTAGVTYKILVGGGGGGGGVGGTNGGNMVAGYGGYGGAGQEVPFIWTAPNNNPVAVTIGAGGAGGINEDGSTWGSSGGTTSFGNIVSAYGGQGGVRGANAHGGNVAASIQPIPTTGVKVVAAGIGGSGGSQGATPGNGAAGRAGSVIIAWEE
jgi:hypothetical protein